MAAQEAQEVRQESPEELLYVGKSLTKVDAVEKVTGKAVYGYDYAMAHMLHGKFKRSDVPHAEIVSIDTTKAMKVPGVRTVLTGADIPNALFGAGLSDTPIIARDIVRYVGEPIAAVAAETVEAAEEAVDLIEVKYHELPTVFDPEESLKEHPPAVLHPDIMKYKMSPKWPPNVDPKLPNVSNHVMVRKGDVDSAFKKADLVVENRYTTNLVHHVHTEPNAAVGKAENDGTVVVWTSTQSVYRTRHMLCEALQLPPSKVRVVATEVGGGFGNKLSGANLEAVAVLLAKATGRPVRIQLTREEVFGATTTRHPFVLYVKDGVMKDGRVIARQVKAILDGGAYSAGSGVAVGRNTIFSAVSTYDLENIKIDTYRVYTNKVPAGAFRGFGTTQMVWAIESQMDMIAEKLGLDPVQFRLTNVLKEGMPSGIGEIVRNIDHGAVLIEASRRIDLDSKKPPSGPWLFGKGIALSEKYSGEPGACASVRYRSDGTVEAFVSVQEIGQGTRTGISQIVAEDLKIPMENVKVIQADTFLTPYDSGALSSRQTYNIGNAVLLALKDMKRGICEVAAKKLGRSADGLEVRGGNVESEDGTKVKVADLFIRGKTRYGVFLEKGDDFWGYGTWIVDTGELDPKTGQSSLPRVNTAYTSCAWAVEVAVNTETGEVKLLRNITVADAGKLINPKLAEGQMEGAVSQGVSTALYEELVLERGKPVNADFKDYRLLSMYNAAPMEIVFFQNPSFDGPFGAKPIGEVGIIGVSPAIANAIYAAVGIRLTDLPMTAERILKAIATKKNA